MVLFGFLINGLRSIPFRDFTKCMGGFLGALYLPMGIAFLASHPKRYVSRKESV